MLEFLSRIKLTVTQWVLIMAAGTIGVLVALLRLQKSRLHASQLLLLQEQYKNTLGQQEDKVAGARKRLTDAMKEYHG